MDFRPLSQAASQIKTGCSKPVRSVPARRRRMVPLFRAAICLVLSFARGSIAGASAVDYQTQVKVLLAEHCYKCHGPSQQMGGLRLDTVAFALAGGKRGPGMTPRDSSNSLILNAVLGEAPGVPRMPLGSPSLSEEQVRILKTWIDEGAQGPADETAKEDKHWSFIPPVRPTVPTVKLKTWVRNPIDAFVLARLEEENVRPSAEADPYTVIRRVSLDLTGLPPSIEETDAFVTAYSSGSDAYEKLVDSLLASAHFGERWGRHWLDLARYADSNGFSIDGPRTMWKYRDWVVQALNRDMPFDQFVIEQIAGDLLSNPSSDQLTATGFHRNTQINEEFGADQEEARVNIISDRVDTTGSVFLGITIGCARCHDHKFDPISQRDYYRLYAFFNSTEDSNSVEPILESPPPHLSQVDLARWSETRAKVRAMRKEIETYADSAQAAWEQTLTPDMVKSFQSAVQVGLRLPPEKRSWWQNRAIRRAFEKTDKGFQQLQANLDRMDAQTPATTSMVMRDLQDPRETHMHIQGDFTRKGDRVTPGVPAVLSGPGQAEHRTRLDLARWLVQPDNPLTARVVVNRIWQKYFGRGIVETENDLGTQGSRPTHPELLDWLATELVRNRWSQKAIHRLIVTSSTYRQSSQQRDELQKIDPLNKLLARQVRLRLEAEIVRDQALVASGLLNTKVGGPSVFPPQPEGAMSGTMLIRDWDTSRGADRFRRGLYTYFWRNTPHPALSVFDAPDANTTCTRRIRSNVPLQALTLLNDQAFLEQACGLAMRAFRGPDQGDFGRLEFMFRLVVGRKPSEDEVGILDAFLAKQRLAYRASKEEARKLVELGQAVYPSDRAAIPQSEEFAAWIQISRVLLNLDESITRE
ncbi:MAG: PSD1 and planctomycete cytochrome C domain-containing protein [Acidobacteriota bacterium]